MTKAAAQCAARPSRSYFDLHDQLAALEKAGLLLKVDIPVNKDTETILWAMTFRAKPHLDMQILPHREEGHGPRDKVRGSEDSSLLVNATLRQDYPPLSLPKREYMERARSIWEDVLELPKLKPQAPWYGYDLGAWTEELEHQAELAVRGDYWETGRIIAQRRRRDVAMNTEVRDVADET
jgi:hypothetical protein